MVPKTFRLQILLYLNRTLLFVWSFYFRLKLHPTFSSADLHPWGLSSRPAFIMHLSVFATVVSATVFPSLLLLEPPHQSLFRGTISKSAAALPLFFPLALCLHFHPQCAAARPRTPLKVMFYYNAQLTAFLHSRRRPTAVGRLTTDAYLYEWMNVVKEQI